jgi:hypothetical protein
MTGLFFSYSHKDETLRDELQTHLTALERQGILEMWHDRGIGAGKEFDNEISQHLEEADIILLLVSPDFIASDYIKDIELERAMERHHNNEARVIPVILRPCRWKRLSFGKLLATPTDGEAVTKYPTLDDAFLEFTEAIEKAIEELGAATETAAQPQPKKTASETEAPLSSKRQDIRSSNLRVKKQFTDHEKDQFLYEAFEYIANFFEQSLAELQQRNPEVATTFRRIDSNHFSATAYVNGHHKSGCRIWIGGRYFSNSIGYAMSESGDDSSYNEMLNVIDDGYSLFLKPSGIQFQYRAGNDQLTNKGGAEYFWRIFIDPLQR